MLDYFIVTHWVVNNCITDLPVHRCALVPRALDSDSTNSMYWHIHACCRNGWTALHISASKGYEVIVRELLARGAAPNLVDKVSSSMPVLPASPTGVGVRAPFSPYFRCAACLTYL
jgi:hypothetical protein